MSSVYKIITKVLATRLNELLSDTISENQSAFIPGRQILDAALIANEAVEDIRSQGNLGLVFKLDFEKAYDQVCWGFFGQSFGQERVWEEMEKLDFRMLVLFFFCSYC